MKSIYLKITHSDKTERLYIVMLTKDKNTDNYATFRRLLTKNISDKEGEYISECMDAAIELQSKEYCIYNIRDITSSVIHKNFAEHKCQSTTREAM